MANARLIEDDVYRFGLASPLAFADWTAPTVAEMNANPDNLPSALIWNLTCALNQDTTTFDLDDPDLDDSVSFCQRAGSGEVMTENATVVYNFFRSKGRWLDAANTTVPSDPAADGYNVSELALSLMAWRGVEYFAWMSIGKKPDAPFEVGDDISLIRVATDYGVDEVGTGENARMTQSFGMRGDILWRYRLEA